MADPKLKLGNDIWATKQKSLLAYNDEGGNFKSLPFQVVRISSGTYVGRNGLIQTAASNEPRIDFLNNTKGHLLLEPQSTNLITYSEDYSQTDWSKTNVSITTNSIISPDGTLNASLLTENSSNAQHFIGDALTLTSGTSYSVSVYAKKKERSVLQISPSSSHIASSYANYDLDLGVVSATGGSVTAEIEYLSNDWYRCILKFTATNTATATLAFFMQTSTTASRGASYQGNGTSGLYLWGAQVEALSYATSYIVSNSGSATTRSADIANNSGNADLFNDSEGVLYAEIAALTDVDGDASLRFISLSNGTSSKRITIYYFSSETFGVQLKNDGYEVTDLYIGGSVDRTQFNKIALYYSGSNVKAYLNGIEVFTNSSWIPFPNNTINTLNFTDGSLSNSPFYGKVKDVRYYNTALSDSELQALTTI